MPPRRRAAFGLWIALTFSCGVLVHGVVHAAGERSFEWDSPQHAVMSLVALALLAAVAVPLGLVGTRRERRRRLALVRASLGPATPRVVAFGVAAQAVLAVLLFAPEGVFLDSDRLLQGLLCGLVALLCSAFLFRATRDRVVGLLTALVTALASVLPRTTLRRRAPRPARATVPYRLFIPNRPPPLAA
jgi:ABC-type proline/glycine betaine transport system permease subunit